MENPDHHIDSLFMQRALELAAKGRGEVSPNPMVGAVIVHDGRIIGEGWHRKYGGPHAEVNAINSIADKSIIKESAIYVNLEPCSHHGKTPPCADLLINYQVKRVVIANDDPNPLVAGAGIKKLRSAGIEVATGICYKEGREMNKRFFTFMEKQRPHIILKWAQTTDGFIARENYDSKWISNVYARQLVHKWRAEEDAVLVGRQTAGYDDPQLNVRDWTGRDPIRVVIDRYVKLNSALRLFDGTQKTICYNVLKDEVMAAVSFVKLGENDFISSLIKDLYKQKIQSVIIEGGSTVLNAFIEAALWDEARVFVSDIAFGKGISAPALKGNLMYEQSIRNDKLLLYTNA